MAYKFRLGSATLSDSLVQEGDLFVSSSDSAESARNLDVQGSIKLDGTQVFNTDRDLVNLVDVDGTGDLTMGTITMTGFAVDADGDTALKSLKVDDGSTIGPDSIGDMITLAGGGDITIKDGAYDFDIASHDATNGLKLGGVLVTSTAAELNLVDGITAGTVAASKAVIVDANKDISGYRNVDGDGDLTMATITMTGFSVDADGDLSAKSLVSTSTVSGSGQLQGASLAVDGAGEFGGALSGSSKLEIGGTVRLDGVASAVAAAADLVYFRDADDSLMKGDSFADVRDNLIYASVSGDATIAAGGALTIAADAVEPSMMSIFDDSLAATNKHIMIADGSDYSSFELSGDISMTNAGVVSIAADAVHATMLNDDVISAQTELALDGLAAADELLISDGGTLKKIGVDNLFIDGPALLTEAAMTVADDYVMFLDGGATGDAKKEKWADLVGLMAGAGLSAASGQLSVTGNDVALKADGDVLAEGYNYFADISAGNVGVDLPAAPTVGDVVHVKAGNITNSRTLRVACQGSHLIDGEANVSLESPYAAISLVYVAANAWRIV